MFFLGLNILDVCLSNFSHEALKVLFILNTGSNVLSIISQSGLRTSLINLCEKYPLLEGIGTLFFKSIISIS